MQEQEQELVNDVEGKISAGTRTGVSQRCRGENKRRKRNGIKSSSYSTMPRREKAQEEEREQEQEQEQEQELFNDVEEKTSTGTGM